MTADLLVVAVAMRLDHLAVQVSRVLSAAAVPHALIKGASTARWLYPDGDRRYRDVDVLVPVAALTAAIGALVENGVVRPGHARLGEFAPHSLSLTSPAGAEVDLHVSLPADPHPHSERTWQTLAEHVEPLVIDGESVPALDVPARCLVLAMHLVGNGFTAGQALDDLQRALAVADEREWGHARALSQTLRLRPHLESAVAVTEGRPVGDVPPDLALRLAGASGAALQLDRIRRLRRRARVAAFVNELVPSRAFLLATHPVAARGRLGLAVAYVLRCADLLRGAVIVRTEPSVLRGRDRLS